MIGPRHRGALPRQVVDEGKLHQAQTPLSPGRAIIHAITEVFVVLAMALALSLVIKTFLVQAFFIPSQSMENTLLVGDRVVVSKLTPGPFNLKRGDVIVFKDPGDWLPALPMDEESAFQKRVREVLMFVGLLPSDSGQHLIKRVIGLPGDRVVCCDTEHRLTVNGVPITEPYIYPGDAPSTKEFDVTIPADKLWVMGDHRSVSQDSRYHENGYVPISDVVGKAFVVVWPLSRMGGVTSAGTTFSAVK